MKKIYSSLGIVAMICFSNSAFSQKRISTDQVQPILEKLQLLGKQNPSAALPLDKLSKEEIALYKSYKLQQQDDLKNTTNYPYGITEQDLKTKVSKAEVQPILNKIKDLGDSQLAFPDHLFTAAELKLLRIYELQNLKTPKATSASTTKLLNKAYALDGRTVAKPFGTLPLTPPITMTVTGSITNTVYCDDIAGDGKMYGLDNATRNLVRINNTGNLTVVATVTGIPALSTLSGLSWNSVTSKMYVIAGGTTPELYTLNMTTGAATLVGATTGMASPIWLEIDNAGKAYSADITTDKLYSVNLTTGAATEIGALGVNMQFAQDADFNTETNVLYAASYTGGGVGGIYTINTSTGVAALVGDTTPNNAEYTVFSIANTLEPVILNKAFTKNSNPNLPVVFATMPLTPPNTLTSINTLSTQLFADDMAGDGNLYALDYGGLKLVKVFSDGTTQPIGPLTNLITGDGVTGLSWNRANNTMYATSLNNTAATLYTVDLATGSLTVVGTIAGSLAPIWLEIDNAGVAYIADVLTDKLYSLDLATAVATEKGNLGVNIQYAQDADFNTSNNVLYMSAFLSDQTSNLYTVDTASGTATLVGSTGGNELTTFTIADTLPDAPVVAPLTCGDTFYDTGGAAGNYGNSEDIVTHIAPTVAGEGVKITFTQVDIERSTGTGTVAGCWDYMSIYNGSSISSPALAEVKCGEPGKTPPSVPSSLLSVGDSFTSTDPTGQLTVRFRSDSSLPKAGWAATISCAVLAVDNASASKFSYYPNPTNGILNISASNKIESIEIFNVVGQKVMSFAPKSDRSEINMSSLPKGLYLVKAMVNGKVTTNKVIKK